MAHRARQGHPRPPARRGGALSRRGLVPQPPVNGYSAVVVGPGSGTSLPDRTPSVSVMGVSLIGIPVDLQVEWRRQEAMWSGSAWVPDATYTTSISAAASGSAVPSDPTTELAYGTWWVRVRAGASSTGTWSLWSAQRWIDVRPVLGSVVQYLDLNVGTQAPPLAGLCAYIDMNVGVDETSLSPNVAAYLDMNVGAVASQYQISEYLDLNIGPQLGGWSAAEYTDLNVVPDLVPSPHIWWIRPEQGRQGYVFNIFGQGFGTSRPQYDGRVMLGSLPCEVASWRTVPSTPRPTTVTVLGKPRATSNTMSVPWVSLSPVSVVVAAGDSIDFDLKWDTPANSRLDILPYFTQNGAVMGYGPNLLLNDSAGAPWISNQPGAYGAWQHRTFTVPDGHYLVGKTITDFGVAWYGYDAAQPQRGGSVRSFVIRRADGTVKAWLTGDDATTTPTLVYTANSGSLVSSFLTQEGHQIVQGTGLNPDTITPEYGWIVAVVPSGAVSSLVSVVLEG